MIGPSAVNDERRLLKWRDTPLPKTLQMACPPAAAPVTAESVTVMVTLAPMMLITSPLVALTTEALRNVSRTACRVLVDAMRGPSADDVNRDASVEEIVTAAAIPEKESMEVAPTALHAIVDATPAALLF